MSSTVERIGFVLTLVGGALHADVAHAELTANRILVIYNANWPTDSDADGVQDSRQVAEYYALKRGIANDHLLGLTCSTGTRDYYTNHVDFFNEVIVPTRAKLSELGPSTIDVLLTIHGVPIRTPNRNGGNASLDNALMGLNAWTETLLPGWSGNPYFETTPTFATDKAHFDHATYKFSASEMYLVTRIDGPRGVRGPLELIDQALYGERYISSQMGYYQGVAYVDSRNGTGAPTYTKYTDIFLANDAVVQSGSYSSSGNADRNIAYAEHFALASGFALKWENTTHSLEIGESGATYSDGSSAATAENALFYFGWYNYGTFHDVFSWLPGSVACDLNSGSLAGLRNENSTQHFGVPAVVRGATAVAGVTGEPYLTGHPRPHVLAYYILNGYPFAEAAALSTPSIGWMPLLLGDPLYAPTAPRSVIHDTRAPVIVATSIRAGVSGPGQVYVYVVVDDGSDPEVVTAWVDFGPNSSYGTTAYAKPGYFRRQRVLLEGIVDNSIYHYRVSVEDPMGNTAASADYTFTLNTPPAVSAGPDQVVYDAQLDLVLAGVVDDAGDSPNIHWSMDNSTAGTATFVDDSNPTTTVQLQQPAQYQLRLLADDGVNSSVADTVLVASMPVVNTLPSPWLNSNVGSVTIEGVAGFETGIYTVVGSGTRISSNNDQFHLLYQPVVDDCQITVRVTQRNALQASALAGIMIRASMDADAVMAFVGVDSNEVFFRHRETSNTTALQVVVPMVSVPKWLRLTRLSNRFRAEYSDDGSSWTPFDSVQMDNMPATVLIGMAVNGNSDVNLNYARFEDVLVSVTPVVNTAPVVEAGGPHAITLPQNTVLMNGSVTDAEDQPTIVWSSIEKPVSSTVQFADNSDPTTTVTFDLAGNYVLQLSADDGINPTVSDTVTIQVNAEPTDAAFVDGFVDDTMDETDSATAADVSAADAMQADSRQADATVFLDANNNDVEPADSMNDDVNSADATGFDSAGFDSAGFDTAGFDTTGFDSGVPDATWVDAGQSDVVVADTYIDSSSSSTDDADGDAATLAIGSGCSCAAQRSTAPLLVCGLLFGFVLRRYRLRAMH